MQDIIEFESCLRRLYNTASGVYCQALLTTAYLKWSKELRSHLHLQLDCDVYEELWSTILHKHHSRVGDVDGFLVPCSILTTILAPF